MAPTNADLAQVFHRINEVSDHLCAKIDCLRDGVASRITALEIRVDTRLTRLEERGAIRSKIDWLVIGGIVTAAAGAVNWLPHALKWW